MSNEFGRRDLIKLTVGAAVVAKVGLGAEQPTKFFTPEEFALVDELTEVIIPADDHSPGAKAAQVAAFIDARLAEAFEQEERDDFRNGLKLVDDLSNTMHNTTFVKASPEQRVSIVTRLSRNEKKPKTAEEKFFRHLKSYAIRGYYTSKIGIHDEMDYKGNTYQTGEYAGYLPS